LGIPLPSKAIKHPAKRAKPSTWKGKFRKPKNKQGKSTRKKRG